MKTAERNGHSAQSDFDGTVTAFSTSSAARPGNSDHLNPRIRYIRECFYGKRPKCQTPLATNSAKLESAERLMEPRNETPDHIAQPP